MPQSNESRLTLQPSGEIIEHFKLRELGAAKEAHKNTIIGLLQNGLYYMTVGNAVSALSSFSSAASYIYALKNESGAPSPGYDAVLNIVLGYVEKLQIEARSSSSSSGSKGGNDKEDAEEIDVECETFGCEEDPEKNCLTFDDVVGMKQEKATFFSAIAYPLIYPNLYTKSAKGILLYGPPGTGKTFIIKAAVRELSIKFPDVKVLFFPLTGADLKGKYVGETEKKIVRAYTCAARRACQMTDVYNDMHPTKCLKAIKEAFEKKREESKALADVPMKKRKSTDPDYTPEEKAAAKGFKNHPQYVSVVFIDEFDAVGGDRSKDESGMTANAVNTMLQMMDGLQSFNNVITVCATNFPWNLDSALLRRFNEQVYCNVPAMEDIKTLVTKEQENRLKYFDENKRKYCSSSSMTKFYTASNEMKGIYSVADKAASCAKGAKNPSIVDIIDNEYLKDRSAPMIAAVSEMAEKHYSNSDVSSVMQKAFNKVSESALRSTLWQKVNYLDENYWISRLTKLRKSSGLKEALDTSLSIIQEQASADSRYEAPVPAATQRKAGGDDINISDTNEIKIPRNIYIDSTSNKSIFGVNIPEDKEELSLASVSFKVANIGTSPRKFVNIKYISNLPSVLMFNDITIGDVFFDPDQVVTLTNKLDDKTRDRSVKQAHSEADLMDVIFTRVLNIRYEGAGPREDGIDLIQLKIAKILDEIDSLVTNNVDKEIADSDKKAMEDKIKSISADAEKMKELFYTFILVDSGSSKTDSTKITTLQSLKADYDLIDSSITTLLKFEKNKLVRNEIINPGGKKVGFEAIYNYLVAAEGYTINQKMKLENIKAAISLGAAAGGINKGLPSGKNEKAIKDLKDILSHIVFYNENIISFFDDANISVMKAALRDIEIIKKDRDELINRVERSFKQLEDNMAKGYIFEMEPSNTQKLFFFKATIAPLEGDWVKFKASGASTSAISVDKISSFMSSTKKKLAAMLTGKGASLPENIETSVASRIAEAGISVSKYLLTRTTHVGVLDVIDEKHVFIINKKDSVPTDEATAMTEYYKPQLTVVTPVSNPGSPAQSPPQSPKSPGTNPGTPVTGGNKRNTKKNMKKRGGAATRKAAAAKVKQYKTLNWFDINMGVNPSKFTPENANWSRLIGVTAAETALGAAVGGGVGLAGAALAGLFLTVTAPVAIIGVGIGVAIGLGRSIGANSQIGSDFGSNAENLIFNDMLGYWYTFKSPEDNIYVCNMMVAEVFGGDSLDVKKKIDVTTDDKSGEIIANYWTTNLNRMFVENYEMALQKRERVWTQIREYATLRPAYLPANPSAISSHINLKKVLNVDQDSGLNMNKSNFLSFYMDASFINAAIKSYPSTYNPVTGSQLQDYNKNRTKFLEDYAAGKYDKKKA